MNEYWSWHIDRMCPSSPFLTFLSFLSNVLLLSLSELAYLPSAGVRGQTLSWPVVGISFPYVSPNFRANLASHHFIISLLAQTPDSVQTERCNKYSSSLPCLFSFQVLVSHHEHVLLFLSCLYCLHFTCLLSSQPFPSLFISVPPSLLSCSTHFFLNFSKWVRGQVIELKRFTPHTHLPSVFHIHYL